MLSKISDLFDIRYLIDQINNSCYFITKLLNVTQKYVVHFLTSTEKFFNKGMKNFIIKKNMTLNFKMVMLAFKNHI